MGMSYTRLLNPLEYSGWQECLLFQWGDFWWALTWRPHGHQNDQAMRRSSELLVLTPILQGVEGTGKWVNNQSCLCDEVSIKNPNSMGLESFWVAEYIHTLGGQHTQLHEDRSSCAWDLLRPHPMYFLHLALHLYPLSNSLLYNKLVHVSVPLSSVSHLSKLSNPRRGLWNLNLQPVRLPWWLRW